MQKAFIIAATVGVAVAAAFVAPAILRQEPPSFYDPQLKIAFSPPPGWKQVPPPDELRQRYSGGDRRLVAHFQGTNPGDRCNILAFASSERLLPLREKTLKHDLNFQHRVLDDCWARVDNVPAWFYEYIVKEGPVSIRSLMVVVDRGDRKVVLHFEGAAAGIEKQSELISKSISSLRLD